MRRKRTKEEIAATLAPNEARRKALRATGLSREHIRNVVSGAAAEAKGAANPLRSQVPSAIEREAPKAARAEAAEAAAVRTSGWGAVGRGAVGRGAWGVGRPRGPPLPSHPIPSPPFPFACFCGRIQEWLCWLLLLPPIQRAGDCAGTVH
jgi:hypothetical protein